MFSKICIIGVGLIGGSIARAARKHGLADCIVAYGRASGIDNLRQAKALGVIDEFYLTIEPAVEAADLVIISTPVGTMEQVFGLLKPSWNAATIYSDVGSTKGSVIASARRVFNQVPSNFVAAHPIAGSEQKGVAASTVDLFVNKHTIVTPIQSTAADALAKTLAFWQQLGAKVSKMEVEQHDVVLAATSHLPHVLAFALVQLLGEKDEQAEIFKYAAGGFKDFTRIAASDPTLWLDICLANKQALIPLLQQLQAKLARLEQLLATEQRQQIFATFSYANQARERFCEQANLPPAQAVSFTVQPGGSLRGEVRVPGDKSISHRSIMLGSLADGITQITGFLNAEDTLATLRALRAMGVVISEPQAGKVTVHGVGKHGLQAPKAPLYLGNSGTSMRLLSGLLAGQAFASVLTGDKSLLSRPMQRVTEPLLAMGADIKTQADGSAPLLIKGTTALTAIDYTMPMASAQVKSCLLLAGMYAQGETTVTEPAPTRDHTERMLAGFGYPLHRDGAKVSIGAKEQLTACAIDVPSDISSAAFFLVGASIANNSALTLKHVGVNPTRIGIIHLLRLMGATIDLLNERTVGGEPVADLRVVSSRLTGIDIPAALVPLAIDEFPVLFIAAACAAGQTKLSGAKELRVKECDRIQVMADGLQRLGVDAQPTADGMRICGKTTDSIAGGEVESGGDHRIAMSFAIAALRATAPITIHDCENVNTSFPEFRDLAATLGLQIA